MTIQILSPQLANQIAAGEVVERPASVVKELIENSLDAGATRIQVEIEKGGAKRILIRDNGCGIHKDQLALALARHATSKITTLDDLEAIRSLGFRGEALASISSVSRLTLTSRPETQSEAWQAYAEGREMNVALKPAAHPRGSTLEVLDLFYNTPARRKFMRTEKTEFTHIDEVVRRIALAHGEVEFILTHNSKPVRHYRAAKTEKQQQQRLAAICGNAFAGQAIHIDWQHEALGLQGWVVDPQSVQSTPELQYCYVNGRMMRDKLINHAIRQAYQEHIGADHLPAYVLFLTVDPYQVDVNVHPAKHEVRFHQSRLVHDFIFQGVVSALEPAAPCVQQQASAEVPPAPVSIPENRSSAGKNMFSTAAGRHPEASGRGSREPYRHTEGRVYQQLMTPSPPVHELHEEVEDAVLTSVSEPLQAHQHSFGRVLTVCQQRFALVEQQNGIAVIALSKASELLLGYQLTPRDQPLKSQPLLIPLRLKVSAEEKQEIIKYSTLLVRLGVDLQIDGQHATLRAVPLPLRSQNLQILIPDMLRFLNSTSVTEQQLAQWLASQRVEAVNDWSASQAIALLAELERLAPDVIATPPAGLLHPLTLSPIFEKLINE